MFSLTSLTENTVSFKEYEEKVLDFSKKVGSTTIKDDLERLDYQIFKYIDKKIFRNKGLRKLDIKTLLAESEISRHVYTIDPEELNKIKDKNNLMYVLAKNRLDNGKKTIYFLDELIKLRAYGKFSVGVVDLMLKYISKNSYRKTAQIINDITGLNISGSAVWNVVQIIGLKLKEKELYEDEQYELGFLKCENKEKSVLFEELDGVYIVLQGKDRKDAVNEYKESHPEEKITPKTARNKEIKVVSIYEGFKKESKHRNSLVNKKVFAQIYDQIDIKEKSNKYIDKIYDNSKIKMIIKNSDGGTWTKEKTNNKTIYQLDMFHVKEAIVRGVREKNDIEYIYQLLKNKKYEDIIPYLETLKYKYDGEVLEIEKLKLLQKYVEKNKRNFVRYQDTKLFKESKEKGNWYRNLGTQEATNYQVITSRMKKRRMSFSKLGADNLCRVLAMVMSYDYQGIEKELNVQTIPLELKEKDVDNIEYQKLLENRYTSKKKRLKRYKYNEIFIGSIPGIEYSNSDEMQEIRRILC